MIASSRVLLVALAVALTLGVAPVAAQKAPPGFRVTYNVDKTSPTNVELSGQVYNDNNMDAVVASITTSALPGANHAPTGNKPPLASFDRTAPFAKRPGVGSVPSSGLINSRP